MELVSFHAIFDYDQNMRASPERAAAIAAGESFYFTGKACCKGHLAKRSVVGSRCATCASQATMRCQAKRPDHPARTAARERGERHYSTGHPCKHGHDKRWVSNGVCVECGVKWSREWDARNPDYDHAGMTRKRRAKDPTGHRNAVKCWAQKNREKVREALKRWQQSNPERLKQLRRAGTNNRRARVASNGGSFTADDVAAILLTQNRRCAVCPSEDCLEIDHVVPIVRGGSSFPHNLQLLCLPCNRSKGSKTMEEWLL